MTERRNIEDVNRRFQGEPWFDCPFRSVVPEEFEIHRLNGGGASLIAVTDGIQDAVAIFPDRLNEEMFRQASRVLQRAVDRTKAGYRW